MMNLTIEERVDNGWRWLDENFPGWQERISVDTLDLASAYSCICGQVFAEEAASLDGWDGFIYARDHLFAHANSWITLLVEMEPVDTDDEDYSRVDLTRRGDAVAVALGFNMRKEETVKEYDVLQAEWLRRLGQWREDQRRAEEEEVDGGVR